MLISLYFCYLTGGKAISKRTGCVSKGKKLEVYRIPTQARARLSRHQIWLEMAVVKKKEIVLWIGIVSN